MLRYLLIIWIVFAGNVAAEGIPIASIKECEKAIKLHLNQTAMATCKRVIGKNERKAQFYVAMIYENGGRGIHRDYKKAVSWYEKSAKNGLVFAQSKLGQLYSMGKGVEVDHRKAFKWYQRAANNNNKFSQLALGKMYESGRGVIKDYVMAHKWFNLYAADGHKDTYKYREFLTAQMTDDQIKEAHELAEKWLTR